MSQRKEIEIVEGGMNVYADLGSGPVWPQLVKIVVGPVRRRAGRIELQFA